MTAHWLSIEIALAVDGLRTKRPNTPSHSRIDRKRRSGCVISIKNLHSSLCEAKLLYSVKHRISEVFTSGDVSLHNIVIFLSYKPFETCQLEILLWITLIWYKIFMVKFQMSTCNAGDGIFKSYLTNISTEHSLNTTMEGLLHSVWWYLIIRSGKWSLKKYSPVSFLCDLCHNIPIRLYLDQTYLGQITATYEIQKVKFGSEHV